jgi:hypothetical protein
MVAGGSNAINIFYKNLSVRYGYQISPEVSAMNSIGWGVLCKGRHEDAIKIFENNTLKHPGSPDAYNFPAEGYIAAGNIDLLSKSYDKAVELVTTLKDENSEKFKRRLEDIKTHKEQNLSFVNVLKQKNSSIKRNQLLRNYFRRIE